MIISTILGETWLQKPKRGLFIRYFSDMKKNNIRDIRNVRKVIKKKSFRRKKQVKKARCVTGTTTETCSNQISIFTPIAGPSSSLVDDDVADTSSLVVSHDDAYWRNRDLLIRRQFFGSDSNDDDDVDVDLSDYDAGVFDNAVVDEDGDVIAIKSSSMNASTTNGDMVTIKSELLTEVLDYPYDVNKIKTEPDCEDLIIKVKYDQCPEYEYEFLFKSFIFVIYLNYLKNSLFNSFIFVLYTIDLMDLF